ncbi:esterase [Amycolatopsis antarctica]|uniref:Esterase n=1 Tax=Amycolatopsis antarctica TaxID=1854586 RepID=A0A263D875_9PSEU|nr:esterase [Amycolatopsis antarctica]
MTRRGLLLGGLAVCTSVAACGAQEREQVPVPYVPATPDPPAPPPVPVSARRVYSAARGSEVDLVVIAPEGVPIAGLPVCLALHGKGSNARGFADLGVPAMLSEVVDAGTPPFALVALDGAHYWVDVDGGDDPLRMLVDELPGWLADTELGAPAAALGISMGAFGALRYAREQRDMKAIAACSPALFVDWPDAEAREVFANESQWESHEPLRHTAELGRAEIGVWCGEDDPFAGAARKLVQATTPARAEIGPGEHDESYWTSAMPEILRFVGARLA